MSQLLRLFPQVELLLTCSSSTISCIEHNIKYYTFIVFLIGPFFCTYLAVDSLLHGDKTDLENNRNLWNVLMYLITYNYDNINLIFTLIQEYF